MESNQRRVISLLVDNQSGVLAGCPTCSARGFNIDSLTVSASIGPTVSRITVSVSGTEGAPAAHPPDRASGSHRQVFVLQTSPPLSSRSCFCYKVI